MVLGRSALAPFVDTATRELEGARLLVPDPAPVVQAGVDESKQQLRVRRFLFASAFSLVYLGVLAAFLAQGKLDRSTFVQAAGIVAACVAAFYALFRTGLNLRFRDPSLTEWQYLASVFAMLFVTYRAPDTRLAFTAFFFVALMFCMLRHTGRQVAVLGGVSLAGLVFVVGLRYWNGHDAEVLRLDVLQVLVVAVTLPWFVFVAGHVKRLQRGLSEVHVRLGDLQERARRDDLTGVYNRRALLVAMEEAKRVADVTREPLSLCVLDLDLFKRYNDEIDHLAGDGVLRAFAKTVQGALRGSDIFGRYGGEEFVQILRHTALAGATAEAERLRERVVATEFPFAREVGPLTVSIGVAQYRPGETIMETFARADAALYKAKQRGRNRVAC